MQFSFWSPQFSLSQAKVSSKKLDAYITQLHDVIDDTEYSRNESSIFLAFDQSAYDKCQSLARSLDVARLKYVFIIGIGGSNLGAKAVYDAIYGMYDAVSPVRRPKLIWMDTVDEGMIRALDNFFKLTALAKEEFAIVIISKSGTTTETIVNANELLHRALKNRGTIHDRIVVITDEGSLLWDFAWEKEMPMLSIPQRVGGRFSVFTAAGLFPLMLAGLDTEKFISGAQRARNRCLVLDIIKNPALASAVVLYAHYTRTYTIHDTFLFSPALESLGKWYRQLTGESLGKEGKGIIPTVSIGTTDLHSVGQLYMDGPGGIFTTFVTTTRKYTTALDNLSIPLLPETNRKSTGDIRDAILGGTIQAFKKRKLPHSVIVMDDIDEQSIGEFMQYKMIEVMLMARLMKVNAFDQPAVELYKKETRRLLRQRI